MFFAHPELARTATSEEMMLLGAAADQIGATDPFESLADIDTSTPFVTEGTEHLDVGRDLLKLHALPAFEDGRRVARDNWRGPAADDWDERAEPVGRAYGSTMDRTELTAAAGRDIAAGLDGLATSAATQTRPIAAKAVPAAEKVVSGTADPEDFGIVDEACEAIAETVRRQVAQIPDLTRRLDDLTESKPAP